MEEINITNEDVSSVIIKNEIFLTEEENEQCLEEEEYTKGKNSIVDVKPVTKVEVCMEDESNKGHSEHIVDQDVPSGVIKNEVYLTEAENEEYLAEDDYTKSEKPRSVVGIKPIKKLKLRVVGESSKGHNAQFVFQLGSYAATNNNNINKEVNSAQNSEQYQKFLVQSECGSFSLPVLLLQTRPIEKKGKYQCDVCAKTFTRTQGLVHHKLIHAGIKKYKCDICNKAFTIPGNLTKHKLIHTGIKMYQCDTCGKTFATSCSLSQHKLIHAGIKKYKCDVCNKAFSGLHNLQRHSAVHAPNSKDYKCDICDKGFTLKGNLNLHKLIHTGVKKYKCDICNKAFTCLFNMSRHKVIHSK